MTKDDPIVFVRAHMRMTTALKRYEEVTQYRKQLRRELREAEAALAELTASLQVEQYPELEIVA